MGVMKILDLTISETELEQGMLDVVRFVRPGWRQEDVRFMNFTEGITNKLIGCYHVRDIEREDGLVMRVYGEKTDLIIDRDSELSNMQILHAAGCGAPLLARFNNGIVYGFVPGVCLDADNVRTPAVSRLVSLAMARMHLIDPEKLNLDEGQRLKVSRSPFVFPRTHHWLTMIPTEFDDPHKNQRLQETIPSQAVLEEELDRLERTLPHLGSPSCFSHNDLLLKNIVYNEKKERIGFIDFEYGAYNYEAFDIGNHFSEWAGLDTVDYNLYPSRDVQLPWLRTYLEQKTELTGGKVSDVTDHDVEVLYVQANKFALMSHLFWGIWALIQAKYSTIDFDYLGYAKIRLDEYFAKRDQFLGFQLPH